MIQVHGDTVQSEAPLAHASAPVRTADVGGWTDTWFAGQGAVCNLAIPLRVHVLVRRGHDPGGPDALRDHLVATLLPGERVWLDVRSEVPAGSH